MRTGDPLRTGSGAGTFNGPVGTCRVAMAYTLCTLEYWKSLSLSSNSIMLVALSLILNHYLDISRKYMSSDVTGLGANPSEVIKTI